MSARPSRRPPVVSLAGPSRAVRARPLAPTVLGAIGAIVLPAAAVRAQAPGVPIAPSAFVAPGLAYGANVASEGGRLGGLAVLAFGNREARWQVTGGVGALAAPAGYRAPAVSYGGRLGLRLLDRARFGVVGFAGFGRASYRFDEGGADGIARGADEDDGSLGRTQVPVGVSVGMRGQWGAPASGRAWGASLAPAYVWSALRAPGDVTTRAAGVRATALVEVALSRRLGVSVAYEDGRRARPDEPGTRGGVLGLGIAFAR